MYIIYVLLVIIINRVSGQSVLAIFPVYPATGNTAVATGVDTTYTLKIDFIPILSIDISVISTLRLELFTRTVCPTQTDAQSLFRPNATAHRRTLYCCIIEHNNQ